VADPKEGLPEPGSRLSVIYAHAHAAYNRVITSRVFWGNMLMRLFSIVLAAVGSLLATVGWRQPPVHRPADSGASPDVLMYSEFVRLYCPSRGPRRGWTTNEAGH
jgi:hypothetical protein